VLVDAAPGRHTLAVSRPGYVAVRRQIDVAARAAVSIPVTLEPAAADAQAAKQ
jgi:hypothetical protein